MTGRQIMKLVPVAVLVILLLAGCTFTPVLPEPSRDASSPTPAPSPSAGTPAEDPVTTTPDPDGVAPEKVTCRSLLAPETLDRVDRNVDGLQFWDDIDERMVDQGSALAVFVNAGGVVCQIGYPGGDNAYSYAYATMTDKEIAAVTAQVLAEGKVAEADGSSGVRYCAPAELAYNGEVDCYLFRGDTAFYSSSESELEARVDYAS